jgi:hypothetical protein
MGPGPAQMPQQLGVRCPGFFEHVGQHGEAGGAQVARGQLPVVLHGLGQFWDGAAVPGQPGGVEGHAAEWGGPYATLSSGGRAASQ